MTTRYDLAIIGGGPAGYAAALSGAASGLNVCIVEKRDLGGVCLHRGCIPTKQLLETASVFRTVKHAARFGVRIDGDTDVEVDWGAALDRKASTVESLHKGLASLLKKQGVVCINGTGRLGADDRVEVLVDNRVEEVLEAGARIVAPGSRPKSIPGLDIDGNRVITSNEALELPHVPERIAIVGGGAIGVEFASMFSTLGSEVALIEAMPSILPGADVEIANYLGRMLKRSGVKVHEGVSRVAVDKRTDSVVVGFEPGSGEPLQIEVDYALVATGRRPATEEIGADASGMALDERGFIEVDADGRSTTAPGVFGAGDAINTPALAHVAFAEGARIAGLVAGQSPPAIDYSKVPWCIYSHPEVAFAGMSEEAAREEFGNALTVARHRFGGLGRALILGEPEGMVKVLAVDGGPIVGVHIVGPWASELLSPGYLAANLALTPEQVAPFVQPHPSLSEAFGEAVRTLAGQPLHG